MAERRASGMARWDHISTDELLSFEAGVIRWEDPPSRPAKRAKLPRPWSLIATQLRARPGKYALIDDDCSSTMPHQIRRGSSWWGPRGAFEVVAFTLDRRMHLWARFVGDKP